MSRPPIAPALTAALLLAGCASAPPTATPQRYAFAPAPVPAGYTVVAPQLLYDAGRGFGFEPGYPPGRYFSVDLAEGNYRVSVRLGDDHHAASTTIKSEIRRLMLENVTTAAGQQVERSFIVNVRRAQIHPVAGIAAGTVALKAPRETETEAWNWDGRLTLEFSEAAAVRSMTIAPVQVPTLFLLGDSTVSDQPGEPYTSWGQMLPRFFKPTLAVANHAESGETYRDSLARRRIDKIVSQLQPGDTVLMQFGHNDQKQLKDASGGPFTTYQAEIRRHVAMVRARQGVPVLVTPVERRRFGADGKPEATLSDYATAVRQCARELGVAVIDLNALSQTLYAALGETGSQAAFALPESGRLDNTHHNRYGSYELAKAVILGLRQSGLPLAAHVVDDFQFDPARPDPVSTFVVPPSPARSLQRPLGDESNAAR